MLIREWRGEGPLADIEIQVFHAPKRGWCITATGSWHDPDQGERIPVDAAMPPITTRSPSLIMDMVSGAIHGQEYAMQTIAQWAITNGLVAHRKERQR